MRKLIFSSGWKEAPHLWKTFIFFPLHVENNAYWLTVSFFGFAVTLIKD